MPLDDTLAVQRILNEACERSASTTRGLVEVSGGAGSLPDSGQCPV